MGVASRAMIIDWKTTRAKMPSGRGGATVPGGPSCHIARFREKSGSLMSRVVAMRTIMVTTIRGRVQAAK